jgi:HEAT repeat protein
MDRLIFRRASRGILALALLNGIGAEAARGDDNSVDTLIAVLAGKSSADVRNACEKLGAMGPAAARAVPALSKLADDKSEANRLSAVRALAAIHTPETIPALVRAADGPDALRNEAFAGLQRADKSAIPVLEKIARDGPAAQAAMALSTLGYMGADSVPAIERLRPAPDATDATKTLFTMALTVARCQSRETFIEGWRTSTQAERDAAGMVEIMMGRRSLGALLESLTDRDPMLRKHAAMAAVRSSLRACSAGCCRLW